MRICFIWHMHQPYYKDLQAGVYTLPWVRLHGVKDYLDMVTILDEFPGLRQCFNLVPSLLVQLEDYANGDAEDRHLFLSRRRPEDLSREEKIEISEEFFSANYENMIKPHPRYRQLYLICQEQNRERRLARLSDQDILDLQVWFNATWVDPSLRQDARIKSLYLKGKGFSEADKQSLLTYQIEILGKIVRAYRDRQDEGRIEVSFSPFYHPILPLLIDTDSARIALPRIELPRERFAHPEDADYHVHAAVELYQKLFDRQLRGMWPSEGSVSEAIVPILANHGIKWIATDQRIYFASVGKAPDTKTPSSSGELAGLYRPYRIGANGQSLGIIFRDYALSDKIGFVYSHWDAQRAAADFVSELRTRAASAIAAGNPDPVISVILDGENCWEYYPNDGIDFLRALYSGIQGQDDIRTVLPSELFGEAGELPELPRLFAGSWIDHSFRVWIGHEEDNRAWDLLTLTRDRLMEFLEHHPDFAAERQRLAWEEIHIAEGSDWCWWYGDEHQTTHFHLFDRLFRTHLLNVWRLIDTPPPVELLQPIRRQSKQLEYTEPSDWLAPTIDGKETHFFEWFAAGKLECSKQGGAAHRSHRLLRQLAFGYDRDKVYLRVDFEEGLDLASDAYTITVEFYSGRRYQLILQGDSHKLVGGDIDSSINYVDQVEVARGRIIELSVPQKVFEFVPERVLYLSVALAEGEKELEKCPSSGYIGFRLPNPEETLFWEL